MTFRFALRWVAVIDTYPGFNGHVPLGGSEINLKRLVDSLNESYPGQISTTVFFKRGYIKNQQLQINDNPRLPLVIQLRRLTALVQFLIENQESFDFIYLGEKTLYLRPHLLSKLIRNVNRPIILRVTSTRQLEYIKLIPAVFRKYLTSKFYQHPSDQTYFLSLSKLSTTQLKCFGVPKDKIVQIPNGVDLKKFCPAQEEDTRQEWRKKVFGNLDRASKIFIYTGRIIGFHKRVDDLLSAWQMSGLAQKGHRLLLVGAPKRDIYHVDGFRIWKKFGPKDGRQGTGKLPGTYWAGEIPEAEMPQWLQMSDYFVLPSEFEGFSNSAVEAMATGLPLIGRSGVSGHDELISEESGRLFDSPRSLSEQMQELAAIPPSSTRSQMQYAARKKSEGYSLEAMTHAYWEFFSSLSPQKLVEEEGKAVTSYVV